MGPHANHLADDEDCGRADFHLAAGSVGRNTGLASFSLVAAPSVDLEGTPRPRGSGFDLGAYEYAE